MTDQPEKMPLTSMDIAAEKREALKQFFPEVFAEDRIDFDQLKRVLGDWVEPDKERFGLTWPGKAECMRIIQSPSVATLKPVREESVNFDETENVFIEGDNLEVLKLLQKAYFGKVKMIYIDPPYNTGGEFIYPDKYAETLDTYLAYTGQIDDEGRKFSTNTDSGGRYHSNWLSMMYPRLYLARNLLAENGAIAISIGEDEHGNLRALCNDIFGEENFVASLMWEKSRKNDAKLVSVGHDYILIYVKNKALLTEQKVTWREEKPGAREIWDKYLKLREELGDDDRAIEAALSDWFSNLPKDHPSKKWSRYKRVDRYGPWRDRDISWPGGDGPRYDVIHPKTGKPCAVPEAGWRYASTDEMQKQIKLGNVEFREDHTEPPFRKAHLKPRTDDDVNNDDSEESDDSDDELATQVRGTHFYKQSQVSVKFLKELMGGKVFDNPKDHQELARLLTYICGDEGGIVVDFFAGSGSFGHAVMEANTNAKSPFHYILVQLPEPVNEKERTGKAAQKLGFSNIAALSRERLRKAGHQLATLENDSDRGFRTFSLGNSNFRLWSGFAKDIESELDLHVQNVTPSAKPEDIVYELLLKAGFPLTTKVKAEEMAGKTVYSVEDGALLICLDKEITPALIDALAEADPLQVICLDEGFKGNDQLKANAVQTFKARAASRETEIVFRTV